jgi:2'-5' RNA ligase
MRCFIAVDINKKVRRGIKDLQQDLLLRSGIEEFDAKWVDPENIHLTLKFLGPTREEQVEQVGGILEETARGFLTPFDISVAGMGAFPNIRNPKVIWVGMQTPDSLHSFQQQLEEKLAVVGFVPEKRTFAPHLTLGRVKDFRDRRALASLLEEHAGEDLGGFAASRVIFYRSDLLPSGPVYSVLKEIMMAS